MENTKTTHNDPGVLISLEGLDFSGKTTQAKRLTDWLRGRGLAATLTRVPGATDIGKTIRELVLFADKDLHPRTECLLFAADQVQHHVEVVLPLLLEGEVVVCDRGVGSAIAYQGYGNRLGPELVKEIYHWATFHRLPDLTIFLQVPPDILAERRNNASSELDNIESRPYDWQQRVATAYNDSLPAALDWQTVNGGQHLDDVTLDIVDCVSRYYARRGTPIC